MVRIAAARASPQEKDQLIAMLEATADKSSSTRGKHRAYKDIQLPAAAANHASLEALSILRTAE